MNRKSVFIDYDVTNTDMFEDLFGLNEKDDIEDFMQEVECSKNLNRMR